MLAVKPLFRLIAMMSLAVSATNAVADSRAPSAQTMLADFAAAWRGEQAMPMASPITVAVRVRDADPGEFHAVLGKASGATLAPGMPEQWDVRFELDSDWLARIHAGEISALTAMGQARADDSVPVEPRFGEAFAARDDAGLVFRRLALHFWTRDWPPRVSFGSDASRMVHGGMASVLAYDDRFRSAWYRLEPGMHINADPEDQVNDFPQLIVITDGRGQARLGGREQALEAGEAILIPPGMRHEFWAEDGQTVEMIWIAFGEGA
jgi:mannose-6-phosphate isomerase-like protein (cupin superfamily)